MNLLGLFGWLAPGGTSYLQGAWTEASGVRVEKRWWPTQAEQVAYLRAVVDVFREREWVRQLALKIVFHDYKCARKDKTCQALAIGDWAQKHITYVEELPERFFLPFRLLKQPNPAGDCDDFTVMIASLCESIGIRCRLVAARWGGGYRHIWPEAWDGKRWIRLDATMREPVGLANPYRVLAKRHPGARVLRV